jgi:ribonuclease J
MIETLKVIPLGGLGEIGKNMLALEYHDDIIVIDAGVLFPDENMLGVDFVIPDISYLLERSHMIKAIVITHGHEDHIGALPYVLRDLPVPVYAPRLAAGLIEVKLKEHRRSLGAYSELINPVDPGIPLNFGQFSVEWFRVCHSIPDAMGLAISTPLGLVIHTGDFKIDYTPVDGNPTDLNKLSDLSRDGVLLLLSDSTYAEVPGYTHSEKVVADALERVIATSEGRVMIASFASLISRMQLVIDAAQAHGRRVAFVGRSMVDNVSMALKMGYLSDPARVIATTKEVGSLPPNQVVIMTTGSQGEPTSALVRIANNEHREVSIMSGDTVVISATPIPGNETLVSKTIDNLFRKGAQVLYDKIATVHVHGHASQEELKLILNLTSPKYFVPVHGQHRHLKSHANLANDLGTPYQNIFVLEDGDVLEISQDGASVVDHVASGPIYLDGRRIWGLENTVLEERRSLSRDGFVVVNITIQKGGNTVLSAPEIVSMGFINIDENDELMNETRILILDIFNEYQDQPNFVEYAVPKIKEIVGGFLRKETGRRPVIIPLVVEI